MRYLALFVLLACSAFAADRRITWNPDTSEMSWVSSTDGKTKHVINFRTRLMTGNGKDAKRFSEEEQFAVMRVMLLIESYALESEDWFVDPSKFEREREKKQVEKQAPQNRAALR